MVKHLSEETRSVGTSREAKEVDIISRSIVSHQELQHALETGHLRMVISGREIYITYSISTHDMLGERGTNGRVFGLHVP